MSEFGGIITLLGDMKPLMSDAEIAFVKGFLNDTTVALEWGSGGSTLEFSPLVKSWLSIEHDEAWYSKVQAVITDFCKISLLLVPVNIPAFFDGHDYPLGYRESFSNYVSAAKDYGPLDFILVDGRARLDCAMLGLQLLNPGGVLVIHDFFPQTRKRYASILKYANIVDWLVEGQSIVALQPRV